MAFFLGFVINENKKLLYSLQGIYGFGSKISSKLIVSLGLSKLLKFKNLESFHLKKLLKIIFLLKLVYGSDLKQQSFESREKLRLIKHRRALRFFKGLPVRGQRTKTNAQTAKRKLS
mgnify:CR=1 FL=1